MLDDGVDELVELVGAKVRHGYTAATGLWSLYWRDRNLKFHKYDRKRPTKNVQNLLDYLDSQADPIFWG